MTNRFAQARATRIFGLATAVGIMIACGLVGLGSLAARAGSADPKDFALRAGRRDAESEFPAECH